MSVDAVLDTNVLPYAASKDPADRPKAAVGLRLLGTVNLGVPLHYDGVKVVNPFK